MRRAVLAGDGVQTAEFLTRRTTHSTVTCASADHKLPPSFRDLSAIVTDPPYYDYIAYSDLSLPARAWFLGEEAAPADPIFPQAATAVDSSPSG